MGRSDERGIFQIKSVVNGAYHLQVASPVIPSDRSPGATGAGFIAVTGGVFVANGVGGPGVPPPPGVMTVTTGGMPVSPGIEVNVNDADVTGLRVVQPSRR